MRTLPILGCFALAAMMAAPASATTYTSIRNVGGAAVDLAITTDGVLGSLATADITGFDIDISDSAGSVDLTPANSSVLVEGSGLTATANTLTFDFSSGSLALFELGTIGDSEAFYCVTGYSQCDPGPQNSEAVSTQTGESPFESTVFSGPIVIATAGSAAVPEPATWCMMLTGLGFAGFAMRRQTKIAFA